MYKYFVASFLLFMLASCSNIFVNSKWSDAGINIDGIADDWTSKAIYFDDEQVSIRFQNDEEYLYICLSTLNRMRMNDILMRGVIIWLKPDNGSKMFGVKYPIAETEGFRTEGFRMRETQTDKLENEERILQLLNAQNEVQVINEEQYSLYLIPTISNYKLKAKLGLKDSHFIYELRVPLLDSQNAPITLNSSAGEIISISIESPGMNEKIPMGSKGRRGTGGPGMGGMSGSAPSRMPGSRIPEKLKELDLAFEVQLTAGN